MTCVIVNDASCLIDLRKGGLLAVLCDLPYRSLVPLSVRASEVLDLSERQWRALDDAGADRIATSINYTAFLNDTLVNYCAQRHIEFTRSRLYRKNDQAWIEQKNGTVVRRFVGYERYAEPIAGQALAHLRWPRSGI